MLKHIGKVKRDIKIITDNGTFLDEKEKEKVCSEAGLPVSMLSPHSAIVHHDADSAKQREKHSTDEFRLLFFKQIFYFFYFLSKIKQMF